MTDVARLHRHLFSWALGARPAGGDPASGGCATIVLEDPADLDAVLTSDLVGQDTVVLRPGGPAQDPRVVGFDGSLTSPGEEFATGDDVFLQVQEYRACPYMSLLSGTIARVTDTGDFAAYLDDADRARATGGFAAFTVNPAVRIADACALGAGPEDDGPVTRLVVRPGGELATSPSGAALGQLGDSLGHLVAEYERRNAGTDRPCGVCLEQAVPAGVRLPALDQRPWLGRYLDALEAVRDLAARGVTAPQVSGFGARLLGGLPQPGRASDDVRGPLLLWTDEDAYVHVPQGRRTFRLGHRAAGLAEALFVCGSVEAAAEHADPGELGQVAGLLARWSVPTPSPEPIGAGR